EWQEGLDVMVEGEAFRITDPETLRGLAAAWQTKWDGFWKFEVTGEAFLNDVGGVSFVFRIEPRKVLAFGKGTFTHTRHVFGPDRDRRQPPQFWWLKAASNDCSGNFQSSERTKSTASAAPWRRSMPASSHSIELGPSYP